MTWLQRYRLRHYVSNSIWVLPVLAMIAALAAARVLHWRETGMGESGLNPGTAQVVLATLSSSMFTFIVFVSSALLLAVQLASAQLTPRIIALVFRDPVTKISLVLFVFVFTFTLAVLARVTTSVPPLTTYLAAYGCLASLGAFLFLIDHVGKALRPSGALWAIAQLGRGAIETVYPRHLADSKKPPCQAAALQGSWACTLPARTDGVVIAFDARGLVALAQRGDGIVEMVPQVGDFVAVGDPLFRIHQRAGALPAEALYRSVVVGAERTVEQDPTFAFRMLVDIASKGLSPAINDPTTAVLALDHIHHLLRNVGGRHLDEGRVRDAEGRVRLVYPTPDWEDFVLLAITEIRQFGATSIQIVRRLRAMLEDLTQALPEERTKLLGEELRLLRRSAERIFAEPEDRALAEVSDFQGVGGKHGQSRPAQAGGSARS